jgi:hypothetical protein
MPPLPLSPGLAEPVELYSRNGPFECARTDAAAAATRSGAGLVVKNGDAGSAQRWRLA